MGSDSTANQTNPCGSAHRDSRSTERASTNVHLRAEKIALPTARLLASRPRLSVYQLFDNSINLTTDSDELVSLVMSGQDAGPFSVQLAPDEHRRLSFKQLLEHNLHEVILAADVKQIRIGPVQVGLQSGQIWNPRLDQGQLSTANLEASAAHIWSLMNSRAPEGSLPLEILAGGGSIFAERVRSAWSLIEKGVINAQPELCASGAQLATGVGIGLTPAGDDFLTGILLAFWLGMANPEPYSAQLFAGTDGRTGLLSLALLSAAARGEASESWHTLAAAISREKGPALLLAALAVLSAGHSSGADTLFGFVLALRTIGRHFEQGSVKSSSTSVAVRT